MATKQTRVLIRDQDKPLVQAIQSATGVKTPSEAISLLLNSHAKALVEYFENSVTQTPAITQPSQVATVSPLPVPSASNQPLPPLDL